jgi:hypothetical protein
MLALACLALFGLPGCLYTGHHYNNGRILSPGNTAVTVGYGSDKAYSLHCPDRHVLEQDSAGVFECIPMRLGILGTDTETEDTLTPGTRYQSGSKFSLGYRLGVRGPWGPFTGAELGWHLEAPTAPITAEFDFKLGLPNASSVKYFHSVSLGWGIGVWVDNSFFAEYAAARSFGQGEEAHTLYASYRATYLATQPFELMDTEEELRFQSHRRLVQQASLGFHWSLPGIPILPDYFSPQITATTPWVRATDEAVPPAEPYIYELNLGFGWKF